jgi:UDP-2-acetamido-3-amino-2,3-dideoxy-glucuronate N-acetyltransferase
LVEFSLEGQSKRFPLDKFVHPTADVSEKAQIGEGTSIWHHAQVREGARIGSECIIGKGVYVGEGVTIGNRVKIQNYASVYEGLTIEDGVMIGPHVCFTNDLLPRAITPDGKLKESKDWKLTSTVIREGAGLGANSTIVAGVEIGRWALVGAGSVVTRNVPDYGLVYGNPARLHGFVSPLGDPYEKTGIEGEFVLVRSKLASEPIRIPLQLWESVK